MKLMCSRGVFVFFFRLLVSSPSLTSRLRTTSLLYQLAVVFVLSILDFARVTLPSTNSRHHFITISVCTSAGIRFVIGSSLFQRRPAGPVSSPECDVDSLWWCNSSASSCFSNSIFNCGQLLPSAEMNTLKCVCSSLCFASCAFSGWQLLLLFYSFRCCKCRRNEMYWPTCPPFSCPPAVRDKRKSLFINNVSVQLFLSLSANSVLLLIRIAQLELRWTSYLSLSVTVGGSLCDFLNGLACCFYKRKLKMKM